MDDVVLRAMQKWPNVPRVYGWLRLDRRGRWLVKNRAGGFDPITNPAFNEFIGRNYAHDEQGQWFFQNGPQRVFVILDYTPWVFRLDDRASGLIDQAGNAVGRVERITLDEDGALVAQSAAGPGLILDRDLSALLDHLHAGNPMLTDEESLVRLAGTPGAVLRLFGEEIPFSRIRSSEIPGRCGFVAKPEPPPGEPDC